MKKLIPALLLFIFFGCATDLTRTARPPSSPSKFKVVNGVASLVNSDWSFAIDTDTLVVDSANNRVGIKNAVPAYPLHIGGYMRAYGLYVDGSDYFAGGGAGGVGLFAGGAERLGVTSSGNVGIGTVDPQGKLQVSSTEGHGGYIKHIYEASATITAAASVSIDLNIPSGWRVLQCQLHVNTALAAGETWDAELNDGGTEESIVSGAAVAQNTNVNHWATSDTWGTLTDAETDIVITKNGGGSFTAQGVIEGHCLCEGFDAWDSE